MGANRPRSSSISSIMTTNGANPNPNFDVHTLYRIKTSRSSKKLDHFFGEQIPHDICIKEIKKEGLKALLQSKVPLCYFLYHLLEEYSHENLFFFIELEQYETFQYVSRVQQLATAQHIFNTYLTRNSHFEVNLDDKVRRTVTDAIQRKDVETCFETAKRSVYSLLESSYMRFMMTDSYHQMVSTCGELTTHYPDETRFAAVNVLLGYIEREHAMIYTNPLTDAPVFMSVSQTTKRRHELIKSMLHEFCRTLVGVEFNYYRHDPNDGPLPLSSAPSSSSAEATPRSPQQIHQQQRSPSPPESKSPKQHGKSKFDFLKKK
ncbi:RGS domain-containing protein [Absidia repens]|uniref:RGS domain-containing protein n=1 Tax=Absidia repens TaxID=90262 RepID=A0A1X2I618_9FUNG|nr:RGS domain-containing protein [Absidia repens]